MTGMIATIEQALVARLRRLTTGEAGYQLHVDGYAGQLESPDGLKLAMNRLPAAYVTWVSAREDGGTLTRPRFVTVYRVILMTRQTETPAAARHGIGDRIGSYQLLADVTALLTASALGLEIAPCRVSRSRAVYTGEITGQRLSVIELELTTAFAAEARPLPEDGDIGEFLALHVEWTGRDEAGTGPLPHPDPAQTTPQLIEVRP